MVAGQGRLGRSLAGAFRSAGHSCVLVSGRRPPARLPVVEIAFLAVPDPFVAQLATQLSDRLPPPVAIVHVSGTATLAVLDSARAAAHPVGAFHPFQSFPAPRPPAAFVGSLFGIDAADEALAERLFTLARDLGGNPRRVPDEQRALYHVAAVLSSNLMLGLTATAAGVLESLGWSRAEALAAIVPLQAGVIGNVAELGLPEALIGPIRRGDPATVRRHLAALDGNGLRAAAEVYRMLAKATLDLALEAGLDPAQAESIKEALTGFPAATRRKASK